LVRGVATNGTIALAATDRLKIDGVVVLGDVTTTGALNPGQLYDNTQQTGIVFAPTPFWKQTTTTTGPTTGPWNKTESRATNVGSLVQMNVNGNALVLYQTANYYGSSRILVCLKLPQSVQCSDFSQYSTAVKYFTPIVFYGFGFGSHELTFDNREYGKALSVDAYQVLP
jgi:hypothetical protein